MPGWDGFFHMNGCRNAVKRYAEQMDSRYIKKPSSHPRETPSLQPGTKVTKKKPAKRKER